MNILLAKTKQLVISAFKLDGNELHVMKNWKRMIFKQTRGLVADAGALARRES